MNSLSVSRPRFVGGLSLGLAIAGAASCTTSSKKEVAKTALDAMSRDERRDTFEATARVLDEHPELVDEFYSVARKHRPLLDRFLANASKDLSERSMAELAAAHLVENPAALEQTMITSLDFVAKNGPARAALNRAIAARAEVATDILTDSPEALDSVLEASLITLERKPEARKATLSAVRKNRKRLLAFLKREPELTKDIGKEVLREAVKDNPVLEKALRGAKILGDDRTQR